MQSSRKGLNILCRSCDSLLDPVDFISVANPKSDSTVSFLSLFLATSLSILKFIWNHLNDVSFFALPKNSINKDNDFGVVFGSDSSKNPRGSLVIFGGLSLAGGIANTNNFPNTGFPQVEQQVTETSQLSLAVYPASPSETLNLAVVLTISQIVIAVLKRKGILDPTTAMILSLLILPFIGGAFWMSFHQFRYGDSEPALFSVFSFGYISSILIVGTRMILPALIYHDTNNLVQKSMELFSSDIVIFVMTVIWVLLLILFVVLLLRQYDIQKGKNPVGVSM